MLGIYNPEIPVQSATPISVLLDNLAVPSEARSRSICFPRSCSPGTGMRLDGFPGCALARKAAGSRCYCALKETGQVLWTGHLAVRAPRGGGGGGQHPFWPGRHHSRPQDACREHVQSGEGLSEEDVGPGAAGMGEQGDHRSAPNPGEKQEAETHR